MPKQKESSRQKAKGRFNVAKTVTILPGVKLRTNLRSGMALVLGGMGITYTIPLGRVEKLFARFKSEASEEKPTQKQIDLESALRNLGFDAAEAKTCAKDVIAAAPDEELPDLILRALARKQEEKSTCSDSVRRK